MENRLHVKTQCTGGPDCALGISSHPVAPTKYPLGCSLCRSEKMEFLVKDTGKGGFNVEQRNDMMAKHGAINICAFISTDQAIDKNIYFCMLKTTRATFGTEAVVILDIFVAI